MDHQAFKIASKERETAAASAIGVCMALLQQGDVPDYARELLQARVDEYQRAQDAMWAACAKREFNEPR